MPLLARARLAALVLLAISICLCLAMPAAVETRHSADGDVYRLLGRAVPSVVGKALLTAIPIHACRERRAGARALRGTRGLSRQADGVGLTDAATAASPSIPLPAGEGRTATARRYPVQLPPAAWPHQCPPSPPDGIRPLIGARDPTPGATACGWWD